MKKYIDTEWLENNAKEYSLGYYEEDEWATPLNVLDSAPSIDIVRCRECKYASDDGTYGCMCEHFNDTSDAYHRMWSDDFCSRGERNRSEKPNNCEDLQDWKDRMWAEAIVTEPQPTTDCRQTDCYMCKWLGEVDVCGRCRNRNLFCEAEPQPRCPKCGKRGYIRSLESMGVKLKVFDEYKWKCTNCNKYFKEEPKDELTTEDCSMVDKDINVRSKDEPQTCSFSDCDNFKNPDYERCIECKRKQREAKGRATDGKEQTMSNFIHFVLAYIVTSLIVVIVYGRSRR